MTQINKRNTKSPLTKSPLSQAYPSNFRGGNWAVGPNKDVPIYKPSKASADEWAHPVDPVLGEVSADNGWAEGAGRVHGPAAEWAGREDVGSDNKPDGDGRDDPDRALFGVGGRGIDGVDQSEGRDDLEHHSFQGAQPRGESMSGNTLQNKSTIKIFLTHY